MITLSENFINRSNVIIGIMVMVVVTIMDTLYQDRYEPRKKSSRMERGLMGNGFYLDIFCVQGHQLQRQGQIFETQGYCPLCGSPIFMVKCVSGDTIDGRESFYSTCECLFYYLQENHFSTGSWLEITG